ncbi:CDP-glycerol glycerophosphotransferase family protein [Streptomyces sp. NPDC058374]|uniref:bifunctional glycosyltransferase/CDP-glycerol:glycerophosphate glycerophosphotransferase n=1 Tax=unclassified Streptomyces TaxID=2593676 RepID=UPI00364A5D54
MPRFSVVVPVHRVQGYLRECLDSLLGQELDDPAELEVIAVDDASPDASGAILDEYAARDPRLTVVRHAENRGIGQARNTGVAHATGTYLLFLDSDDTLTPGSLRAIGDRAEETGSPDIVLYDYERTFWWNGRRRNRDAAVLAAPGPEVFTVAERPELLDLFTVVWNKAFRRDFFLAGGFTFPDGYYEDAVVVYESLFTAARVTLLDRVCVSYRQRRRGNALRTPDRAHFAVFDQYGRLFRFLDTRPELHRWRSFLFHHMTDHYLFILSRPDRVPPAARAEFFARAARDHRRHAPPDLVRPGGVQGAEYRALEHGSYLGFQALRTAAGARLKAVRELRRTRTRVGRRAYAAYYRAQRQRPLDPGLAVYAAYWYRPPACNPYAVFEKARQLAPGVRGVWVVRESLAGRMPEGVDFVVAGSPRYWEVLARATYFINNVNFPDHYVKRPGQLHLQTHHGTPLKRMGIDQIRYPAAAKGMSFAKLLARADRWDYSLSSNQLSAETWERVYPCSFTNWNLGYPRNDVYARATPADTAAARARVGVPEGRTAVLYAPTVRDYQSGYVPRLDLARLARALGTDGVLMVRTHYFYGDSPEVRSLADDGVLLDVSTYPVVEDLCLASDALLTDYSSIMFDYANLDRPIVTYADDWEVYVKSRGVTFDLLSGRLGDTPGAVATSEDELIHLFEEGAWDGPAERERRRAFRARFCPWDDGAAAERVVRALFRPPG